MSKPDDIDRLRHMLDAAREAVSLSQGMSDDDLRGDRVMNLALVRLLEIIGEAANKLSASFRKRHPEIPWVKITGTRNRLIHGYFSIDPMVVSRTVREELPALVPKLEHHIAAESRRSDG